MMRSFFIFLLLFIFRETILAQGGAAAVPFQRKGLFLGMGFGAGTLQLSANDTSTKAFSFSIPNIKIGYMLTNRFGMMIFLPGSTYQYRGKVRGFEGVTIAAQYWVKDRWWLLAGSGVTFDAPAFYTVKDPKEAEFYFGFPAITAGTGIEIYRKGKFAIDLQYRFFMGKSLLRNNQFREGTANFFLVGFNWY